MVVGGFMLTHVAWLLEQDTSIYNNVDHSKNGAWRRGVAYKDQTGNVVQHARSMLRSLNCVKRAEQANVLQHIGYTVV
jgi:hypothetical protein